MAILIFFGSGNTVGKENEREREGQREGGRERESSSFDQKKHARNVHKQSFTWRGEGGEREREGELFFWKNIRHT